MLYTEFGCVPSLGSLSPARRSSRELFLPSREVFLPSREGFLLPREGFLASRELTVAATSTTSRQGGVGLILSTTVHKCH